MNPDYLVGSHVLALALGGVGLLRQSPEERANQLEEARRREVEATAAKRAASPDVAKAEAKRARKAAKLRKLTSGSPS